MTTFQTEKLKCFHCKRVMYRYGLSSYHVFKSTVYSDGFVDANPPIPRNEPVVICSSCERPMWVDDVLLHDNDWDVEGLDKSWDVYDLTLTKDGRMYINLAQYYSGLLDNGFADNYERELFLRMEIWHLLNHAHRYKWRFPWYLLAKGRIGLLVRNLIESWKHKVGSKTEKELNKRNLDRMIAMYKPADEDEKLLLAEMCRENKQFKKSIRILKQIPEGAGSGYQKQIFRAAFWHQKKVIKLR